MTATLQDAIAAARSGDHAGAQALAAEIVLTQPDDAQAWYLLSQLVDSDARRAAYIHKTLTLDPTHERARAEFNMLPTEVMIELAGTVPETPDISDLAEESAVLEAGDDAATQVSSTQGSPLPEWLQPLGVEAVARPAAVPEPAAAVAPAAAVVPTAAATPKTSTPAKAPTRQPSALWVIGLALLIILTMLALGLLAYLLLS